MNEKILQILGIIVTTLILLEFFFNSETFC
jgi:hypothetical protein